MSGQRWLQFVAPVVLALAAVGCQGGPSSRTVAATEPGLVSPTEPGSTIVDKAPPRGLTFADRHPLFTKPREYYESSGNNRIVKAAAATVIGIPAGLFGELKQIVVGAPVETPPRY